MWERRGGVIAGENFGSCYWGLSDEVRDIGL